MNKKTRRRFIGTTVSAALAGGVIAWFEKTKILRWVALMNRNESLELTKAPAIEGEPCILTAEQVEGPFFVTAPHRSNVKEDRVGKDLKLRMQIVSVPGCVPIDGAIVEIWHCDAVGVYSGYPEGIAHDLWKTLNLIGIRGKHVDPRNEKRFLRGAQVTDTNGEVEFETIFPGWYEPRTPHIHFKIVADDSVYLTSQFYFDPKFSDRVYLSLDPYREYGSSPYTPQNDVVIKGYQDAKGLLLEPEWSETTALRASAKIGIKRAV